MNHELTESFKISLIIIPCIVTFISFGDNFYKILNSENYYQIYILTILTLSSRG